jgi:mycofactocin precursor
MAPAQDDAIRVRTAQDEPVVEETLVEEVSIDGMCGVY